MSSNVVDNPTNLEGDETLNGNVSGVEKLTSGESSEESSTSSVTS